MIKYLTNPSTGETKSIGEWARSLGISPSSFSYRLKHFSRPEDIFDKKKRDRGSSAPWSKAEDILLIECHSMPRYVAIYNEQAKDFGYPTRSHYSIEQRVFLLRKLKKIPDRKIALITNGFITIHHLAQSLNIKDEVVSGWCSKGLKYERSRQDGYIWIDLRSFAQWAILPVGRTLIARVINQDREAIAWILEQIGKWLWKE